MPDIFKVLGDGHHPVQVLADGHRNSGGALVDERGNVVGVVSAKVLADGHHARAALLSSGALPENVNYAVKSSFLLSFLELLAERHTPNSKNPIQKNASSMTW